MIWFKSKLQSFHGIHNGMVEIVENENMNQWMEQQHKKHSATFFFQNPFYAIDFMFLWRTCTLFSIHAFKQLLIYN